MKTAIKFPWLACSAVPLTTPFDIFKNVSAY